MENNSPEKFKEQRNTRERIKDLFDESLQRLQEIYKTTKDDFPEVHNKVPDFTSLSNPILSIKKSLICRINKSLLNQSERVPILNSEYGQEIMGFADYLGTSGDIKITTNSVDVEIQTDNQASTAQGKPFAIYLNEDFLGLLSFYNYEKDKRGEIWYERETPGKDFVRLIYSETTTERADAYMNILTFHNTIPHISLKNNSNYYLYATRQPPIATPQPNKRQKI